MEVFNNYAQYYNLFYQDKDYGAEAQQVSWILKKYGCDVHSIINFGCGTGKHDIELVKLGYQCSGIDVSESMINIARQNVKLENMDISLSVADIRKYETLEFFDAVISLFHVISYQNTNQDVLSTFKSARRSLKQNGIFLFDVRYGPGVMTDKPATRVKKLEYGDKRLIRISDPIMYDKKNIVDVCYDIFIIDNILNEIQTIQETHSMRYFFRPEMEFYLRESGFELIDNIDCKTLGETDYNSWTSYFIARAI